MHANTIILSMDLFSQVMFVHGKSVLYIVMDFKLPPLPVSISYSHVSVFYFLFLAL